MRVIRVLVYEGPADAIDRTMKQNGVKGFRAQGDLTIHESLIGYAYPLDEGESGKVPHTVAVDDIHRELDGAGAPRADAYDEPFDVFQRIASLTADGEAPKWAYRTGMCGAGHRWAQFNLPGAAADSDLWFPRGCPACLMLQLHELRGPREVHDFEPSPVDDLCLRCGRTFGDGLHT